MNTDIQRRPNELSTDTSKVIDTVCYYYDTHKGYNQIWLLLPTCPLRNEDDILNVEQMLTPDIDGVVSITEMEFPPSLGITKNQDGFIESYDDSNPWINGNSRSQDHPVVYRPNGAIYAAWTKKFKDNRNFYKGNVKGYIMDRAKSIDIDTKFDFELVKNMMNNDNLY